MSKTGQLHIWSLVRPRGGLPARACMTGPCETGSQSVGRGLCCSFQQFFQTHTHPSEEESPVGSFPARFPTWERIHRLLWLGRRLPVYKPLETHTQTMSKPPKSPNARAISWRAATLPSTWLCVCQSAAHWIPPILVHGVCVWVVPLV